MPRQPSGLLAMTVRYMNEYVIHINGKTQTLIFSKKGVEKAYSIYTAKNGFGEQNGSEKTPRGLHEIAEKVGEGVPLNARFVGRQVTGETCTPALMAEFPGRDWILTRILWLSGLEPGKNQGGDVDTKQRYIYIHGAPELYFEDKVPRSHGCVCMRNEDVIELFKLVEVGDRVFIE